MDITTYLGSKIIDHMLRNQAYSPPGTLYLGAHAGHPALDGSNEVSGTGYARQALALASSGGTKATSNSSLIQIPFPSSGGPWDVGYGVAWDASSGGNPLLNFLIAAANPNFEATVEASSDTFETRAAHGLSAGDRVEFFDVSGTLPTGLSANTLYYVRSGGLTTSQFTISTTNGGSAVNVTADGGVVMRKVTVQTLNAGNVLQVQAGALTLTF